MGSKIEFFGPLVAGFGNSQLFLWATIDHLGGLKNDQSHHWVIPLNLIWAAFLKIPM